MPRMTAKQSRFVEEYLIDLNATQAAIRAGYSQKTAGWIGNQLLAKTHISKCVQDAMRARSEKTGVTSERVIKELERIAFADPRNVMSWGPDGVIVRASSELTDDEAAIISEVSELKTDTSRNIKIKLADKLGALEKLCKHLGIYAPVKHEHAGTGGGPLRVVYVGDDDE